MMRGMRVVRTLGILLGIALLAGGGCSKGTSPPTPQITEPVPAGTSLVRVAVLTQVREVHIGANDSFTLTDDDGVLVVGLQDEIFNIRQEQDRVLVFTQGGEMMDTVEGKLRVEPRSESGEVSVNGARYPQTLEVVPNTEGGLNVINIVDVETYLRGVIPQEIGHKDDGHLDAAKAQAIAARTYVAAHMNQYADEGFDLYSGVLDQVYGPVDRRHPNADRAVRETRGMVLWHNGGPIRANYASTCGGRTAGVEESFGADSLPYLKSHEDKVDGNVACRMSRYYRWEETWTGPELKEVLARTLPQIAGKPWKGRWVLNVEAAERGKSGRIVKLRVTTDEDTYEVEKGAIRQLLESTGGQPLRSTAFEIEIWKKADRIRMMVARGRGWGHGVGMCQWGAMQLSMDGHDYREILRHYYPGTELRPWPTQSTLTSRLRPAGARSESDG
jgi:stage II sporulation protein D